MNTRTIARPLIRAAVSTFLGCRRAVWYVTRPRVFGVAAAPLTDQGKVVLVKLTYRKGWFLPSGGRKVDESSREAILRELREEIGLTRFEAMEPVGSFDHPVDFRRCTTEVFLVRGVQYTAPAWSLEIEEVREFGLDELPSELSLGPPYQLAMVELLSAGRTPAGRPVDPDERASVEVVASSSLPSVEFIAESGGGPGVRLRK